MNIIKDKKIAIVGGGPGGLVLARLLQMKGVDVTLYERDMDSGVRQQGATLDLHQESGLKALTAAGLLDDFKKHYRPGADKLRLVDQDFKIYSDDHQESTDNDFEREHFRPEIDRGPLRDLLIASLQPGTLAWNSHYQSMDKEGSGWLLHFKNGNTAYADIVVAADGANSKIRPLISAIAAVYSGVTIVEGNIYHAAKNSPILNDLVKGGKVFAFGHEQSIILSAKGDGSLSFYTGSKEDECWVRDSGIDFNDKNQVLAWFKEKFGGWAPGWQGLFASDEMYIVPRPQYHYPLDQSWEPAGNLTMLGDAAHRMPPYAGEGVNMAMLDALELYENLTNESFPDTQSAIRNYEVFMCKRAAEVTRITLAQTESLHAENALSNMLNMFDRQSETNDSI
jgi:2-polyprenyl-6-methoxyphenol hydroxylase-like FAD-dependent oxidoreductase